MSRAERRQHKTDQEKHVLKANNRLQQCKKIQDDLGFEILDPPVRSGYKRIYTLRDDLKNRWDADELSKILKLLNTERIRKSKRGFKNSCLCDGCHRRKVKKFTCKQPLKELKKGDYDKYVPASHKKYFMDNGWLSNPYLLRYNFTHPYYFEPVIVKNYITKIKILDPDIEKEIDDLEYLLHESYPGQIILNKRLGYSYTKMEKTWRSGGRNATKKSVLEGIKDFFS